MTKITSSPPFKGGVASASDDGVVVSWLPSKEGWPPLWADGVVLPAGNAGGPAVAERPSRYVSMNKGDRVPSAGIVGNTIRPYHVASPARSESRYRNSIICPR